RRRINCVGHVMMMSARQPFISGAISKTVNLPEQASVDDIMDAYLQSWKLGLKAVAIYRDGSKKAQPLMAAAKREEAARRGTRDEKSGGSRNEVRVSTEDVAWAALSPEQKQFALEIMRLTSAGTTSTI